jgi:hypothetical protein
LEYQVIGPSFIATVNAPLISVCKFVPTTEVVNMTLSSKRLLFLAASAVAVVLAIAPVSFAGESDGTPGPTQVGEIQGPPGPAGPQGPAGSQGPSGPSGSQGSQGPAGTAGPVGPAGPAGPEGPTGATGATGAAGANGSNGSNGTSAVLGASHTSKSSSKGGVLGTTATVTNDTVQATGGIQAGFGGMATKSSSLPMTLAIAGGILLVLAASAGLVPLRRRSQD